MKYLTTPRRISLSWFIAAVAVGESTYNYIFHTDELPGVEAAIEAQE